MLDKTGGSETRLISCGRSNRNKDAAWMQLPEQMNEELQLGIVDAQLLRLLGSDDHGSPEVSGTAHQYSDFQILDSNFFDVSSSSSFQ